MPVVLPDPIENGDLLDADAVMEHINTLASKFTEGAGGIGNDDFTGTAGRALDGSKIADDSLNGSKLEDDTVTAEKLASDAINPGLDTSRAVSGDHIKELTAAHLARILPTTPLAGIGSNKLKIVFHEVGWTTTLLSGGTTRLPISPATAFPKATYALVGLFSKNLGGTATQVMVAPAANDIGTDWVGGADIHVIGSGGTVTGTLVYVFAEKA